MVLNEKEFQFQRCVMCNDKDDGSLGQVTCEHNERWHSWGSIDLSVYLPVYLSKCFSGIVPGFSPYHIQNGWDHLHQVFSQNIRQRSAGSRFVCVQIG